MFYLLENPGGHPDYYQEHCYNEPVDVYYGFALVQNPDTVSQLQNAYLFVLLGEFPDENEANKYLAEYRNKGTMKYRERPIEHPVIEPIILEDRPHTTGTIKGPGKKKAWYGQGNVDIT